MKITEQITTLCQAVNGSKQMQFADADKWLYAALAAGLNEYIDDSRQEWAVLGCRHNALKVTAASVQMQPAELRKLLRRITTVWDTLPLSESEFTLFGRIAESLAAFDYAVCSGCPASERVCLLCETLMSQCCG